MFTISFCKYPIFDSHFTIYPLGLICKLNPENPTVVCGCVDVCVAAELMRGNPFKLRANFTH